MRNKCHPTGRSDRAALPGSVAPRSRLRVVRGLRVARNVLIIAAIAALVAFGPGGGNGADAVLTALSLAFLAVIVAFVYRTYLDNQLTVATLSDGRRALLFGAVGLIVLLIAGNDEFFDSGGGTLAWVLLLAAAIAAIWRVWFEAREY